ncbi:MAG TPA: metallophosphoesterase, partial [Candidatus Paceibacterota bacterium]|nr:metallophosphoesterase [Candidatus Paceibacterota bacterium]
MKWIEHHRNRHMLTEMPGKARLLQISDVHYDSTKCDRKLLDKHIKDCDVAVINGDWFDLMGGKYDPRSTYGMIRPEYKNCNYLDRVIEDSYEYLKKFDIPIFIGRGNHETNILKRLHTDPTDRLVQLLKSAGCNVVSGGYSGWIVYHFR